MGYSWAITANVMVPPGSLAAYRAHSIGAGALRGAPQGWGSANYRDAMTVGEIASLLGDEEMFELEWKEDGFRAAGVVSNDSSMWADYRTHLVAAVRAAHDVGGRGEIAITGWIDGAPDIAFVAGPEGFFALRDAEAKAVEERVHAEIQPIVERCLGALMPAEPVKLDLAEPVLALHAEVLAALRRQPPERLMEAASQHAELWPTPESLSALAPLAEAFPSADDLLGALTAGWKNLHTPAAVLGIALELLTDLDRAAAIEIAERALRLSPLPPPPLRTAAEAAATRTDTEAGIAAALVVLREKLRPAEWLVHEHPILRRLRRADRDQVLAVVRRVLRDVVGDPATGEPYKELDDQEGWFARQLTFLLRDIGTEDDLPFVLPLWIGRSHPRLAAFDLAWQKGGAAAKPLFAETFAQHAPNIDYGHIRQMYALSSLLELDPEALFTKIEALMEASALTREQAHAVEAVLDLAEKPETAWSPGWTRAMRAIAARHAGQPWANRANAARAVHRDPEGLEWVVAQLATAGAARDTKSTEWLAGIIEAAGDPALAPRLRELLTGFDKRGRTRVEKSIAKLEGTAPAEPTTHHVGVSPSGRAACRGCKEKIAKGELRFGESVPNSFSDSGEPAFRWYHLRCAAEKKPALLGPALRVYPGDVPDREALAAAIEAKLAKKKR